MSATDIIAIYAAAVATTVLLWDIYKWWANGPAIRASAITGMVSTSIEDQGKKFIRLTVTNVGDKPTTLNALGLFAFAGVWKRIRRRPEGAWVVSKIFFNRHPLPMLLQTGTEWTGFVLQEADLVEIAKTSNLYVSFEFSHQRKAVLRKLDFHSPK